MVITPEGGCSIEEAAGLWGKDAFETITTLEERFGTKCCVLTIGQAGATRKMCPDMTIEDLFLKKLSAIRQYKIDKKEMLLYDEKDQLVMLAIKE